MTDERQAGLLERLRLHLPYALAAADEAGSHADDWSGSEYVDRMADLLVRALAAQVPVQEERGVDAQRLNTAMWTVLQSQDRGSVLFPEDSNAIAAEYHALGVESPLDVERLAKALVKALVVPDSETADRDAVNIAAEYRQDSTKLTDTASSRRPLLETYPLPAQEERLREAIERSADIYPEGRGCPACDGTGFVSDEDIERLRGLGLEVPHSEFRRALGVESDD